MTKIQLANLLWMLLPLSVVAYFYIKYTHDQKTVFTALFRMITQLLLIGYFLVYIFGSNSSFVVLGVLFVMLFFASVISLRPLSKKQNGMYLYSFISIMTGGLFTLFIVIFGVLKPHIWYEPKVVIPLAGMIFANSMNTISIYVKSYEDTQNISNSFKTALIPTINSFFAVGLVSLPGMMTGQILSGVDPLIAVRYQIMVMLMIFSASGIGLIVFIKLLNKKDFLDQNQ